MTAPDNESILPHLRELVHGPSLRGLTDGELMKRYIAHKDEVAFEALLERHGPSVLGVCRRILQEPDLAEDAFQATFLILVRKAAAVGRGELIGGWLHGVAYRVAVRARAEQARRRRLEAKASTRPPSETLAEITRRESGSILEEELQRLPQRYRDVFRLCFVEGQTRAEAARQLNCSLRTLHRRLERGKNLLHVRLLRRGIALPVLTALEGAAASATRVPGPLRAAAARIAAAYAAGEPTVTGTGSPPAIGLAQRTLAAMELARCKLPAVLLLAACVATASAALLGRHFLTDPCAKAADDASDEVVLKRGARTDRYGDPLPPGALARIGTAHRKHGAQITDVAWSPDGTMLASADGNGVVSVWDAAGKELRRFDSHESYVRRVAFLPDGHSIAVQGNGRIHHWNLTSGKPAASLEKGAAESPYCFAISPDGRFLASTGGYSVPPQRANTPVVLSSIATGQRLRTLDGHQSGILALAFSGDGDTLVSASQDDSIRVWDAPTGKQRYRLDVPPHAGHQPPWICLAVSPDSRLLAAGSWDKTVRLWELTTGKMLARLRHSAEVLSVAFSPDSSKLASGARDGTLRVWEVPAGKELRVCRLGRYDWVAGVAFSPDGKTIATGDSHQRVRLWDASTGDEVQPLPEAEHQLRRFALSHKDHFAVTWGMEQTIRFWELSSGRQLAQLGMPAAVSSGPVLSPDDSLAAVACEDHTIRVWDCGSLREVHRFEIPSRCGKAYSLRFSPDGKTLAACLEDKTIRFWTIQTGVVQQFCHITGKADFVSMAFSPDGETVAASTGDASTFAGPDAAVYVWERRTGRELRRLQQGQDGIGSLAFSPNGRVLAVAGYCMREAGTLDGRAIRSPDLGGALRVWDLASGQEVHRFARQPVRGSAERRLVYAAAFSPDGKTLASAEEDGTVVIWEVASGQPRHEFTGHRAGVTNIRFSRDGSFLGSSSLDGTVLVWDMSSPSSEQGPLPMISPDRDRLWGELGSEDVKEACHAISALTAAPEQAVDFLATRLAVLSNAEGAHIDERIADLDSPSFAKRETANRELARIADSAEPALRRALAANPSVESRGRLETLLRGMSSPSPQRLRELRALEVLEHINTAKSRRLLQKLAGGPPQARLAKEARESCLRLAAIPITASSRSTPAGTAVPAGRATAAMNRPNPVARKGDIVKEPDYECGAPRYCLAVFGPRGQTRVWLVLDGEVLYADRDGSGDLTSPGKAIRSSSAVTATDPKGQILSRTDNYDVGLIKATDGSGRRWTLKAGITRGGELHHLSVETDGKPGQSVLGRGVAFAATAKDAPIVHFDGPLAFGLMDGQRLARGKVNQFYALIGTAGKGEGTFAAYQDEVLPAGVTVTAEFKFQTRKPNAPPMIVKTVLRRMAAAPWLSGTVPVPADAAETAQVIVSVHGGRVNVAASTSSVPIVESSASERK